jgi:hypothetical protein
LAGSSNPCQRNLPLCYRNGANRAVCLNPGKEGFLVYLGTNRAYGAGCGHPRNGDDVRRAYRSNRVVRVDIREFRGRPREDYLDVAIEEDAAQLYRLRLDN